MDVSSKTKGNTNAMLDLEELCARNELHLCTRENGNSCKPKAKYVLSRRCRCVNGCVVSLLDGYSFNFSNKDDTSFTKLKNMKSHDYHVFMEVLLSIDFNTLLADVLEPLSALGEFFKNLCANVLCEECLMEMHHNIAIILCKLERIFLPRFWNVTEYFSCAFSTRSLLGWCNPYH